MNKYRIEYCEENGIKVKEFNKYNVNNYTNFLEKKLEAINYTHCCKPPIGLRPKWVSDKERLNEVRSAIVRYYDAELKIPIEWIEEYNQLIDSTKV